MLTKRKILIAKAIGILLIVSLLIITIKPLNVDEIIKKYYVIVGSFHVALFFLLSGMFTSKLTKNIYETLKDIINLIYLLRYFMKLA